MLDPDRQSGKVALMSAGHPIAAVAFTIAAVAATFTAAAAAPPMELEPVEQAVVVPGMRVPVAAGPEIFTAVPPRAAGGDNLAGAAAGEAIGILDLAAHDAADRIGAGQTGIELVQTSLLNQLGSLGFSRLQDFRKIGEAYEADLRTQGGVTLTVVIDPATGEIRRLR